MKFLSITHGGHQILDKHFSDSREDALKYLADFIYSNLDDKTGAREANEPFGVSMDVEGSETPDVFNWHTTKFTDTIPTEGISTKWTDNGANDNVASFIVEIPEDENKFFVVPIGYNDNCEIKSAENVEYQNYAFFGDLVTALNNADRMFAGIVRKIKRDFKDQKIEYFEDYQTREIGFADESGNQHYTRLLVEELKMDEPADVVDEKETDVASETTTATTAPATNKVVEDVKPLGDGEKITTDYLKNWIESVIDKSKILSGNYTVTITRDYKASAVKPSTKGVRVGFKGLVDPKKYPTKVDYRGFTVKLDIGNGTVYEGKIHIISSDKLIAGVGMEQTKDATADKVFDNIFETATTNDPKAAGVSKGSMEKMPVETCIFIKTVDGTKKRMVPTKLLPSEIEALKNWFNDKENNELPERVEFELNGKYGMDWQQAADVVGAMFITQDAKIEVAGEVDLPGTTTVEAKTDDSAQTT